MELSVTDITPEGTVRDALRLALCTLLLTVNSGFDYLTQPNFLSGCGIVSWGLVTGLWLYVTHVRAKRVRVRKQALQEFTTRLQTQLSDMADA